LERCPRYGLVLFLIANVFSLIVVILANFY
jgi:hypothetical protein